LIPLGRADVSIRDHLDTDSSEETELGNGLDGSEGVEYHMGSMGFYNEPFPQKGLGLSVNSKGTVIGIATVSWWYISLTDWTAFIYSSGNYTEIIPPGWRNVDSCKISSRGTVVGTGYDRDWVGKGFIYRRGTYTEIIPPGWQNASIDEINSKGIVVGKGYDVLGELKGFIYSGGDYTEIIPPGW